MFGFVQLVPQLIINYARHRERVPSWFPFRLLTNPACVKQRLKSVAHIPMKALFYKLLATTLDDFFSFIIKMPLLHRLACFRDDVVFVALLYQVRSAPPPGCPTSTRASSADPACSTALQMWIYRVDPTRENEYGQKLTDEEAKKLLEAQAKKDRAHVEASAGETKKTQ